MAVSGARPAELRAVLTRATEKMLTEAAIRVQNEARRLCPVDTGTLRRSIAFSIHGSSPEEMSARIGSNLEYALVVETGHDVIKPKNGKVLRFPVKGGGVVFTTRVKAVPPRPYLKPALQAARR